MYRDLLANVTLPACAKLSFREYDERNGYNAVVSFANGLEVSLAHNGLARWPEAWIYDALTPDGDPFPIEGFTNQYGITDVLNDNAMTILLTLVGSLR